jgi:hypothetical protein
MHVTSPRQFRAMESLMKKADTLVLVFTPTCPHCHTYMPIWKELCKTKGKRTNMISMEAATYDQTPLSEKKQVSGVPSVLYVNSSGQITEASNIRDKTNMTNIIKTGSNIPSAPAPAPVPIPAPTAKTSEHVVKPIALTAVPGVTVSENPLRPLPGTPEPTNILTGGGRQMGGSPWAAFLLAAQHAAPAAALLGAYSLVPHKRSSGLGKARNTRRRRSSRRL